MGKKLFLGFCLISALSLPYVSQAEELKPEIASAAVHGNIAKIKRFISRGGDVNAKDPEGLTLLHIAAQKGNLKLVKYLVSKGADVNARDFESVTPLHLAAKYGHLKVVKFLVSKGADINAKEILGATPLDWATPKVAKYLESLKKKKDRIRNRK